MLGDGQLALEDRPHQRRVAALVLDTGIGSGCQQPVDQLAVAVVSRQDQSGIALIVPDVQVEAGLTNASIISSSPLRAASK